MLHKFLLFHVLLAIPAFTGNNHGVLVSAGAAFNVEQACGNMDFTANQEKYYGKSEFIQHSGLAEVVGNLLSVFFNEEDFTWSIAPEDLKDIVLSNIHKVSGTKIYGSAIAFEPNVWSQTVGLEEGVVRSNSPAARGGPLSCIVVNMCVMLHSPRPISTNSLCSLHFSSPTLLPRTPV